MYIFVAYSYTRWEGGGVTAVTFTDGCEYIVILFKLKNAKIFSAQMQRITRTVANEYTPK